MRAGGVNHLEELMSQPVTDRHEKVFVLRRWALLSSLLSPPLFSPHCHCWPVSICDAVLQFQLRRKDGLFLYLDGWLHCFARPGLCLSCYSNYSSRIRKWMLLSLGRHADIKSQIGDFKALYTLFPQVYRKRFEQTSLVIQRLSSCYSTTASVR